MISPIALRIFSDINVQAFQASINPNRVGELLVESKKRRPAIIVANKAAVISELEVGVIDSNNLVAVFEGNWEDTILIVLPDFNSVISETITDEIVPTVKANTSDGDRKFLAQVAKDAPELLELANATIIAIRAEGVSGNLAEKGNGRWVNGPINVFTLKAQPRVTNLAFTLYGNPESYDHDNFLKRDQNSYSRGWIKNSDDVTMFAKLVRQSYARRA